MEKLRRCILKMFCISTTNDDNNNEVDNISITSSYSNDSVFVNDTNYNEYNKYSGNMFIPTSPSYSTYSWYYINPEYYGY
ncbi:hypothetical protein [Hypsugopox virus]|nr:hypothetical protein [Hypsugopox virus]